jgi:hypothetical protein
MRFPHWSLLGLATLTLASAAAASPFRVDWIRHNPAVHHNSCVETCASVNARPVSGGAITAPSSGDPNNYVCRAYATGAEAYGERAGYNWNGWIGSIRQPGCAVVASNPPLTSAFSCLCEFP